VGYINNFVLMCVPPRIVIITHFIVCILDRRFRIEKVLSRASKSSINAARTLNETCYWRKLPVDDSSSSEDADVDNCCSESLRAVVEEFPAVPSYAYKVYADESGYVVSLNFGHLLAMAKELDVVVKYNHQIGDFVVAGSILCYLWDAKTAEKDEGAPRKLEDRVQEKLVKPVLARSGSEIFQDNDNAVERRLGEFAMGGIRVSKKRDATIDATLGIQQIVDMAVRALSPGVNDPVSAIQCMDALASLLVKLGSMDLDIPCAYDEEGNLRLFAPRRSFSYLASMLDGIRFYGQGDVSVCRRGMRLFGELAAIMTRRRPRLTVTTVGGSVGVTGVQEDRVTPALITQMEQWMVTGKKNFAEGSPELESLQNLYDHLTVMIATARRKRKGRTVEEHDAQDFEITHKDESCREVPTGSLSPPSKCTL